MNKLITKTVLYFCVVLIIAQSNNPISDQTGEKLGTSSADQQINSILALENSVKNSAGLIGETFRPAFNDWIYTGIGGANFGEILYRLSYMVTDNRASGSERVWSEIWGTLINPVRGFNRAISGEIGQNFDNPIAFSHSVS